MTDDRPRQNPSDFTGARRPFSLMKWVLLGAAVVILIPSGAVFFWAWTSGEVFDPGMVAHNRPPPMSGPAALNALLFAYLFALFLGLPLFALWSIVCVIVALFKRIKSGR